MAPVSSKMGFYIVDYICYFYTRPARGGHISVPHPKKDLNAGLVHKLLKQAGLSDERSMK